MVFHKLNSEAVVQVDDMVRFDASKSFASPDEGDITLVRISPDGGVTWFDVTAVNTGEERWYLDWSFENAGDQVVKLELTTSGAAIEKDYTITTLSVEDDCLFSDDNDLVKFEPEILCFLRKGRSSFLDIHRCSQKIIMDWLQRQIEVKDCGVTQGNVPRKLECKDLFCKDEVKTWSVYQTLILIFEGLSNQVDDIYFQKAQRYTELMYRARSRAEVTVDFNQDGTADYVEKVRSSRLTRR